MNESEEAGGEVQARGKQTLHSRLEQGESSRAGHATTHPSNGRLISLSSPEALRESTTAHLEKMKQSAASRAERSAPLKPRPRTKAFHSSRQRSWASLPRCPRLSPMKIRRRERSWRASSLVASSL